MNQNLAQKSITVTVTDEAKKWILNQTLDRSQLWRASAAPGLAEVH